MNDPANPYAATALGKIARHLKQIAREHAASTDPRQRELPATHMLGWWRGPEQALRLELKLTTNSENKAVWRLRASRIGVFPSEVELRVLRQAFEVGIWISEPQQIGSHRYAIVMQWLAKETPIIA